MKKDFYEKIVLPEKIGALQEKETLILKSQEKELRRKVDPKLDIKIEGKEIIIECKKATRKEKKLMNTTISHIKNMISGLESRFTYKLQVCNTHFPVSISIDKENKEMLIKNFLGESTPRKATICNNVDVRIEKDIITLESYDKEAAGQTAANIEGATKIKKRDRRVFQDGIWIILKPTKK